MRIAAFILGVLGALAAGALGATWLSDVAEHREQIEQAKAFGLDAGELDGLVRAAYALIVSLVAGLVGAVLALRGRGRPAALVLIASGILPALFDMKALIFTFLLVLAGLVSLGAKPTR